MRINNKGFTLVELLVVIAIIGLLAGIAIVAVGPARDKARDARRVADGRSIQTAIELFRDDNNGNAPTGTGMAALNALVTGGFMGQVPTDPRNVSPHVYTYANTGDPKTYFFKYVAELDQGSGMTTRAYCVSSRGVTGPHPDGFTCPQQ